MRGAEGAPPPQQTPGPTADDLPSPARWWEVRTGALSPRDLGTDTLSGHNEEMRKAAKQKCGILGLLLMRSQEGINENC